MIHTLRITVAKGPVQFPAGTEVGLTRIRISNNTGVDQSTDVVGDTTDFLVDAGTYLVQSWLLDSAGNALGSPAEKIVTVTDPPVTLQAPVSIVSQIV